MPGGFYWTANSPYVRGTWTRMRRRSKGLPSEIAMIGPDSNPAHMIFECKTNTDWGEGSSPDSIDLDSFLYAAQTLYNEGFGLSMIWLRQTPVEDFVNEVLDHIQAYMFLNPKTGLWTIKLLRADYDADDLDLFDASNATLQEFKRKSLGETVNELVVTWTNPVNEKTETVTVQDLSNIINQGGEIVSGSRNYYGIRNAPLAVVAGNRDMLSSGAPLGAGTVAVDRSAWSKVPGDVVRLDFPDNEPPVDNIVARIGSVDYGSSENGKVIIGFAEDVFGLEASSINTPPGSDWEDPSAPPAPLEFKRIITLPDFMTANYVNSMTFATELVYPEVAAGLLASTAAKSAISYELVGNVTLANGSVLASGLGTKSIIGHALVDALPAEAVTLVPTFRNYYGDLPYLAGFVLFDGGEDEEDEIALIQSIAPEGFTLYRGVMDTVPRAWPVDTVCWFLNLEQNYADETARSDGEVVTYRMLTQTNQGILPLTAETPTISHTLSGRPHYPLRPANVKVSGTGFGPVALDGAGPFEVTWSTRNRKSETGQLVGWTDGSVTPETGQTTTVRVLNPDLTVAFSAATLAGSSYSLAAASLGSLTAGFIEVSSQRDGFDSLQAYRLPFTRA